MVETHFSSYAYYGCVTSHMKLFKPCTTHVIAWSIRNVFFSRFVERKSSNRDCSV